MDKTLSSEELKTVFDKISRLPLYVDTLEYSEQIDLYEYCKVKRLTAKNHIHEMIELNPNYEYPQNWQPNRKYHLSIHSSSDLKFLYWAESINQGEYFKIEFVLHYVINSIIKKKKFKKAIDLKEYERDCSEILELIKGDITPTKPAVDVIDTKSAEDAIPTRRGPSGDPLSFNELFEFWSKLSAIGRKNKPYWNDDEIIRFIKQNFVKNHGSAKKETFNPNMSVADLLYVTYKFFSTYGIIGTKERYAKMLMENFMQFQQPNSSKDITYITDRIRNSSRKKQLEYLFTKTKKDESKGKE